MNAIKTCILGAGSLGSAIGGVLAASGVDVTLIARNRAHVDAVNTRGLRLRDPDGTERVARLRAAASPEGLGVFDLIVVLVKSGATRTAIEQARSLVGPNTIVMSLQNGVGHEDILTEVVGRECLLAGKSYVGGLLLEPGLVHVGSRGKETVIGELDGSSSERVQAVAAMFDRAGLRTVVSRNILGTIWDKLLVNVATGALSGITRLPYGALYAVPELRDCALAAVAEAMAVARAMGIELSTREPIEPWTKAGAGLGADFKASMLQSLERGQRTEIDYINGAVVRHGEKCGVATPVNRALVACIKGIEAGLEAAR